MDRRGFFRQMTAGAAVAAVPVAASADPIPLAPAGVQLVATLDGPITALLAHGDRVFVATGDKLYQMGREF